MRFGTDGVRGPYGSVITPELAFSLGYATTRVLSQISPAAELMINIGRDTRPSGPELERALVAGVRSAGGFPQCLGVLPTPALSAVLNRAEVTGGIMVTASHNPSGDNGLKVLDGRGRKLGREVLAAIGEGIDMVLSASDPELWAMELPSIERGWVLDRYFDTFRRLTGYPEGGRQTPGTRYGDPFPLRGMRIAVDCANGAARRYAPFVLENLGARVIPLNVGYGEQINEGCGATHPEHLSTQVIAHRADAGIALDGDADRGILVLSDGRVLDGDDLLYLLSTDLRPGATVVGTVMSNGGLERALRDRGLRLARASVGDAEVAALMEEHRSPLGGEPSGHVLCSPWFPTSDGLLSCVLAIQAMQAGAQSGWARLAQAHRKVAVPADAVGRVTLQIAHFTAQGARIVVRPSGTEPVVRVMVEHPHSGTAEAIADHLRDGLLKEG